MIEMRSVKRKGKSVSGNEVRMFKRLFIPDLKREWLEKSGQGGEVWESGRNIKGGMCEVEFENSRLS